MGRVILDTTLLIAGERGIVDPEDFAVGDNVSVPAIAIAEYLQGTLRAKTSASEHASRGFLEMVLAILPVDGYTAEVAEHHAELLAHTREVGRPRGAHDLIIAATARATKRTILTLDRRAAFDDLPGVEANVLAARS